MLLKDLVLKNRSYRRFCQDVVVEKKTLEELVDLARLSASASNMQPLKYILSNEPEKNARIFAHLLWARYLTGWGGPAEGERPAAYIVMLGDTEISRDAKCDCGIAAQTIKLGAMERGLGGCMFMAIKKDGLRQALNIPPRFDILLVIALGKPKETVVIDEVGEYGDTKYFRDEAGVHHVPKRKLEEIILDL